MKTSVAFSIFASLLSMGVGSTMAAAIDTTANADPAVAPESIQPMRICHVFSDCGFCGFYERCCYKPYGSHPETEGECKCGTNGREGHCF
ncbi:hypothetical protein V8F20_009393 [Naviculisporaceae sp. PSN 640]